MSVETTAIQNLSEFFSMQWVEVLQALLTPTIAAFAAFIACQQWQLNKASLREKMFDRRMRVYELLRQSYSDMLRSETSEATVENLTEAFRDANFLFSENTRKDIELFRAFAIDLRRQSKLATNQPLDSERRANAIEKEADLLKRVPDEFSKLYKSVQKEISV